jgi:hypothetical protein
MITIVRIEHKDTYGLFVANTAEGEKRNHCIRDIKDNFINDRHADRFPVTRMDRTILQSDYKRSTHLNPSKDGKIWLCAYKSIDQLQQWIYKDEFKILFDNNYKVLLLDVTEYQIGEYQIIFTRESVLSSKDISSLFK